MVSSIKVDWSSSLLSGPYRLSYVGLRKEKSFRCREIFWKLYYRAAGGILIYIELGDFVCTACFYWFGETFYFTAVVASKAVYSKSGGNENERSSKFLFKFRGH